MLRQAICIVTQNDGMRRDKKAPIAMSKYDILTAIAEKVQALGNNVKLKILALLIEEGSKSITDISKELNINFSTAHKYLEQLEAAGLVASKQVSENRMKRMFTIKDFNLALSPSGISDMLNGKTAKEQNGNALKVLNEKGELVDFDEKIFSQKYLKRGMPRGTIVSALSAVLEQAYNGITLLEMRRMLKHELEKKVANISEVFKQIGEDEKHKRTYAHLLSIVHPEALDMHARGDIFIRNLRNPKLLNFIVSFQLIANHGVTGKKPRNLSDLLRQTIIAFEKAREFSYDCFGIDSFNYLVLLAAPVKDDFSASLEYFFDSIDKLGIKLYIGLEVGKPTRTKVFDNFDGSQASQAFAKILAILKRKKYSNIYPVIKAWDKSSLKNDYSELPEFYLINMQDEWQTENASFVGQTRFDASWRGILRTDRVGEAQEISINMPRLAKQSKSVDEFIKKTGEMAKQCANFHVNMMELLVGEFLRKYGIHMPSEHAGAWTFVSIPDSLYSVSLAGLPDAIRLLAGKGQAPVSAKVAKKVLEAMAAGLAAHDNTPIRLALKECSDVNVMKRFNSIDKKQGILSLPEYSAGVCDGLDACELHQMLPAGHGLLANKKLYKSLLPMFDKKKFGAVHVK